MSAEKAAQVLGELIGGLDQAVGGCSHLIHQRTDPRWMMLRDTLEQANDVCKAQAQLAGQAAGKVRVKL